MSSGERPIGAAKGKQIDTKALCQPPPPPPPQPRWGLSSPPSPQVLSDFCLPPRLHPHRLPDPLTPQACATLDTRQLAHRVIESAKDITGSDRCSLFIVNEQKQQLEAHFEDMCTLLMPINAGIAGHVATTGETVNIKDAYKVLGMDTVCGGAPPPPRGRNDDGEIQPANLGRF